MGMSCKVCNHINRVEIDRMLCQGKSYQNIANLYDIQAQAIRRHKESGHVNRQMITAIEHRDILEGHNLLNEIDALVDRTKVILDKAEKKERLDTALRGISELRSTYELLSKIAFALHDAKCKELALAQFSDGSQRREEEEAYAKKVLDRLTDSESVLLARLIEKVNGEHNDLIEPGQRLSRMPQPSKTKSNARFFDGPYKDIDPDEDPYENGAEAVLGGFTRTIDPPYRGVKRLDTEQIPSARDKMKTRIARKKLERMI
jgi:hypothetical protein